MSKEQIIGELYFISSFCACVILYLNFFSEFLSSTNNNAINILVANFLVYF